MMSLRSPLRLKVRQVDQFCVFDLFHPDGQEISATVRFPAALAEQYQNWQQIYLKRYELQTRARVGSKSGSGTPTSYDWDQELRIAETALLHEFDHWLGQPELLEIREAMQSAVKRADQKRLEPESIAAGRVTALLECHPLSLARLPWETWKLGTIRLARTCTTQVAPPALVRGARHGKLRILAIFAAAPELNHALDQKILRSLYPVADITFVHCQSTSTQTNDGVQAELKQRVAAAIADERGWDILFFAGHSNEEANTGGKLELAPQTTLAISEIEPQISVAKQRGLQLAIFNSCCGLNIAESLIRLGLPQVVVMREQIQDAVAHKFLEQFCHSLSDFRDVHTAVLEACQYFAREAISYPSAHLIPSLFQHPDPKARLFRIEPSALKRTWQQWRPSRWEAIAIGTVSLLSFMVPVQELLSEVRYWSQAVYRQTTHQLPPATSPPVVTLLEIDQASIDRKGIDAYKVKPMSRAYLAELVDRLRQLRVGVVGIDYLLDGSTNEDLTLKTAVQAAIQQQTWLVFAARQNEAGQPIRVTPNIAQPDWVLQGTIDLLGWNVMLPEASGCHETCPFAYQLALAQTLRSDLAAPQPQSNPSTSLSGRVSQYLEQVNELHGPLAFLKQPQFPLRLQPILDFSLPPHQVHRSLAAWDFLERPLDDAALKALQGQVVIIASGGYDQADDSFPLPLAVRYWRSIKNSSGQNDATLRSQVFPGATAHAYAVHHLLTQHSLLWIPDLWLLGVAAILGKGMVLLLISKKRHQQQRLVWLSSGGTAAYGLIGLQSYVSASVLLPWLLPSALFWLYILSALRRTA